MSRDGNQRDEPGDTAAAQAEVWRPSFNPWLIAVSVMLATFMEVLDTSVANVALPHIAGSLSASTDEATWVLTSYLSHLTPYDPAFQQRVAELQAALGSQMSSWAARQQAYGMIYGTLVRQASALSFIDTFRLLGALGLICVGLVFFFRRVKARKGPTAMH